MKLIAPASLRFAFLAALILSATTAGRSQSGYGVDATGSLFNFQLSSPSATTTVGNLGFVPEGIDFRPGTSTLYAINVGATLTQLYTVNLTSGAATPIGAGFATTGMLAGLSYSLAGATSFGFDFNPTTLQADGSIRIRLTGNNGTNLRLNSDTGAVANVDGAIAGSIGGVAYINSASSTMGGVTALYDVDFQSNTLFLQNPPNNGTLMSIGSLGVDVGSNLGFDILTFGGDDSIAGDFAYLVDTVAVNSANFYSVNLATGAATSLGSIGRDFTGGLALTAVPEPSTYGLGAAAILGGLVALRRRRAKAAK